MVTELVKKWVREYEAGASCKTIANKYGRHHSLVIYHLRRQNVRIRNKSETKLGTKNPNWLGTEAGSGAVHAWIKRNHEKPALCQACEARPPYDLANISPAFDPKTYTRDINNWRWLCRKCHMLQDGRMDKNLNRGGKKPTHLTCTLCSKPHVARGWCAKHYKRWQTGNKLEDGYGDDHNHYFDY